MATEIELKLVLLGKSDEMVRIGGLDVRALDRSGDAWVLGRTPRPSPQNMTLPHLQARNAIPRARKSARVPNPDASGTQRQRVQGPDIVDRRVITEAPHFQCSVRDLRPHNGSRIVVAPILRPHPPQ